MPKGVFRNNEEQPKRVSASAVICSLSLWFSDASNSGLFLVASAKLLHLRDDHPSQCGNDDSASDEHFHIRYRESPGRRNGYSLHGAPLVPTVGVKKRDFDQRE
jgi:hypothetical protein